MGVVEVAVLVVLFGVEVFFAFVDACIDQMPLAIDLQTEEGNELPVFVGERLGGEDDGVVGLLQLIECIAIVGMDVHILAVPKQEVELVADRKAGDESVKQCETLLGRECPSETILLTVDFVDEVIEYAFRVGLSLLGSLEVLEVGEVEDGAVVGKCPRTPSVVVLYEGMAVLIKHTAYRSQAYVGNHVVDEDGVGDALHEVVTLVGADGFLLQRHCIAVEECLPPPMAMTLTVGVERTQITVYLDSHSAANAE